LLAHDTKNTAKQNLYRHTRIVSAAYYNIFSFISVRKKFIPLIASTSTTKNIRMSNKNVSIWTSVGLSLPSFEFYITNTLNKFAFWR